MPGAPGYHVLVVRLHLCLSLCCSFLPRGLTLRLNRWCKSGLMHQIHQVHQNVGCTRKAGDDTSAGVSQLLSLPPRGPPGGYWLTPEPLLTTAALSKHHPPQLCHTRALPTPTPTPHQHHIGAISTLQHGHTKTNTTPGHHTPQLCHTTPEPSQHNTTKHQEHNSTNTTPGLEQHSTNTTKGGNPI